LSRIFERFKLPPPSGYIYQDKRIPLRSLALFSGGAVARSEKSLVCLFQKIASKGGHGFQIRESFPVTTIFQNE